MTANRRIFLNIVATYGRSLYAVACGLFTGRWALMALGAVDYGLIGVVWGLSAFITLFNSILAQAIGRFFAVSVGREMTDGHKNDEACIWFNIAVVVHTIIPIILVMIGYPIGKWAVENWLSIPPEKVHSCVVIFRLVCVTIFIGMINVPFQAMYTAKQRIAELTVYGFVTSTLNLIVVYYMVVHPASWMVTYAGWMCLLVVVPQFIICYRALVVFPECHFVPAYWRKCDCYLELGRYVGFQAIGSITWAVRNNGMTMLVNKIFGPLVNTAQSIALTVNGHASTLSTAMMGAFSPAIANEYGCDNRGRMLMLSHIASKFGVVLALVVFVPLSVELPYVIDLWLKTPPPYTVGLCWCAMLIYLVDNSTAGQRIAINANGKIGLYMIVMSPISVLCLPLAYFLAQSGCGVIMAIGGATVITIIVNSIGRVIFAKWLVGMGISTWVRTCVLPLSAVSAFAFGVGLLPRIWLPESFLRFTISSIVSEMSLILTLWLLVLTPDERTFVASKFKRFTHINNG